MNDPTRAIRIAIFSITLVLCAFGVVMIYSASAVYADQHYGDGIYFLKRHLLSLVLGGAAAFGVMLIDYRDLRRYTKTFLVIIFIGLIIVLVPHLAHQAGGARRWFPLFGVHIQPSEFAKIGLILFLSDAIAKKDDLDNFKQGLLPLLLVTGALIGTVVIQPDLGASAAMGGIFLIMLFAAGLRLRYFAWLIALAVGAFILAVLIEPYRMRRVVSFMKPWEDMRGAGFQLWQSFLALGSGGLAGVGLGQSQQKLFYLPAAHTDFIFSIIGEELGFIGAGAVIVLFAAFAMIGFRITARCPNKYGQLLSLGLVCLITMEAAINVGVSIGAFPTKGLALPFISYGGSSIIAKLMCVGLLLNISRDARREERGGAKAKPAKHAARHSRSEYV